MITVQDITSFLESVAPSHLQESYDNSGLIVGSPDDTVTGILFCLDSTEDIIEEAVRRNCNMVVAHHPISEARTVPGGSRAYRLFECAHDRNRLSPSREKYHEYTVRTAHPIVGQEC